MNGRVAVIEQPCLFPKTYMFERAAIADEWIHLCSAQFVRGIQNSFEVFKSREKKASVPVSHDYRVSDESMTHESWVRSALSDSRIQRDYRWVKKTRKGITEEFSGSDGLGAALDYFDEMSNLWLEGSSIATVGIRSFDVCCKHLGISAKATIDTDIMKPVYGDPSRWIFELNKAVDCSVHYTGKIAASTYLANANDLGHLKDGGIRVVAPDWQAPVFHDRLLNRSVFEVIALGSEAIELLKNSFKRTHVV